MDFENTRFEVSELIFYVCTHVSYSLKYEIDLIKQMIQGFSIHGKEKSVYKSIIKS